LSAEDSDTPGFQHYVAVSASVSVKTVSVPAVPQTPLPYTVAGAYSATGPVGRPASFPRKRVGGAPGVLATTKGKKLDPI